MVQKDIAKTDSGLRREGTQESQTAAWCLFWEGLLKEEGVGY